MGRKSSYEDDYWAKEMARKRDDLLDKVVRLDYRVAQLEAKFGVPSTVSGRDFDNRSTFLPSPDTRDEESEELKAGDLVRLGRKYDPVQTDRPPRSGKVARVLEARPQGRTLILVYDHRESPQIIFLRPDSYVRQDPDEFLDGDLIYCTDESGYWEGFVGRVLSTDLSYVRVENSSTRLHFNRSRIAHLAARPV
jgi:hypothetical protein